MILQCCDCGYECEYDDDDYDQARDDGWWEDDNGDWYCNECWDECERCGTPHPNGQLHFSESRAEHLCQSCLESYGYRRCQHCNSYENDTGTVRVGTPMSFHQEEWCSRCLEYEREHNRITQIASDFYYNQDSRTDLANGHIKQEHLHPEVWNEISNCPDCREYDYGNCPTCMKKKAKELEEEETNLWVYDTYPESYHNSFHNHFKETKYRFKHEHPYLYYGMEFECLFNTSTSIDTITKEFIKATGGLFVAEYDRSVSNAGNGIEFISRPLSYAKWMDESTYQLLKAGQEVLEKYHAYNPQPEECGIHIHMSLKFFERNTTKKVNEIKSDIDWIFQVFQEEIEKISQRKYTKYCASKAYRLKKVLSQIQGGYGFNLNPKVVLEKGKLTESLGSGDTHHDAIIQTSKTIEIRTFKSTIIVEDMLAIIDFCRCVAHASRNLKLKTTDTLGTILYCKDTKYLDKYIQQKKVDTTKKFANKLEVKINGNF